MRLIITEGQVADIACAQELVEGLRAKAIIADKGYDADVFVKSIRASRAKAVIPPRSNRKTRRRYDRALYRQRNLVERFFSRIKHFRRVATRYDKLAHSYLTFASIACTFGPLVNVNRTYDFVDQVIEPHHDVSGYVVLDSEPTPTGNHVGSMRSEIAAIKKLLNTCTFICPTHDRPAKVQFGVVVGRLHDCIPGPERQAELDAPLMPARARRVEPGGAHPVRLPRGEEP